MKSCYRCKKEKEETEFHHDVRRKDGLFPYCKDCRRELSGSNKRVHKKIGEFNGMIIVDTGRYPYILTPNGSFRAHRYIMEHYLGRKLERGEIVHHIDGNKMNWDIKNLIVMHDSTHRKMEAHNIHGYAPIVTCNTCGKSRTYSNNLIRKKRVVPERYQCAQCYQKSGGGGGRRKAIISKYKQLTEAK